MLYTQPVPLFTSAHASTLTPFSALYSPVTNRLGTRLRMLRKQRGYTQEQLAHRFGIDRSYLSEVERGSRSVSISMLEVFAVGFHMSLAELMTGL